MIGRIRCWRELERWVPGGQAAMDVAFPLIPISDIMRERRDRVSPSEFVDHSPITIHFDGSIERRARLTPFQGAMFAAQPGDVVFSKIDLRNGAIAIVPSPLGKVVVTSEYPIHIPDEKQVDSRYLALLLRSPNFLRLLKGLATGTSGRKRIDADALGALEVPLPDLGEQRALLDAFQKAGEEASALEAEANVRERSGLEDFETALGVIPPPNLPHRFSQVVRYKDIDRWSHEGILDKRLLASSGKADERYSLVTLGDVVADLENGWSPQCLGRPAKPSEWGVLKLGAVSYGTYDEFENKALPHQLKPRERIEVKQGNVLISRANILRLVGACALVNETRPKLMLCDKIFRVVFLEKTPIDSEYLVEVMKLGIVRQQIEAAATGTSPTMKNISKPSLLDLTFPLPQGQDGLSVQRNLVGQLRKAREVASQLRFEARTKRDIAQTDFLNAVFH